MSNNNKNDDEDDDDEEEEEEEEEDIDGDCDKVERELRNIHDEEDE